jgi:uncharacterized membrane protein YjgN (DUF898 family)
MDMAVRPAAAPAPQGPIETVPLRFTGDGGVYLGIWLVNLALMVVTLGLFTPFARRRTLKYFYGHTEIAGHPFEFTGRLRSMVVGFLLFAGLYVAYSVASNTGQAIATAVLGLGFVAIGPWLWGSAQRFRMANTRWRGIRGRFHAGWGQVYAANWPLLALFVVAGAGGAWAASLRGTRPAPWLVLLTALVLAIAAVGCLIRLTYNFARLRVLRTDFGGLPGRWKVEFRDWFRVSVQAFGLFLAIAAVLLGALVLATGGSTWLLAGEGAGGKAAVAMLVTLFIGSFLAVFLAAGPARAWAEARLHALVWNQVGLGAAARFRCDLRPWAFVRLRIRNMLLSAVTFGFWRPFAVTSEYRMKLESVTLHVKGGLDQLVGQRVDAQGAFGDAIADAVGLDVVG